MRIYVDTTEPGVVFQEVLRRGAAAQMRVERTMLHKREGIGVSLRDAHPFYGLGADYVIADDRDECLAAVERKTLDDLAKSAALHEKRDVKIFRQLRDLMAHSMPVLLLEGQPSMLYRRTEPALLGLQLWAARNGISVVYATGPAASAHAIVLLARRLEREAPVVGRDVF